MPICGKMFERILYRALHNHLNDNFLLCESQFGFRCGDSCVNQLLSITNMIYSSFDKNPSLEVRGVFLDISRAFDRVWHAGLLFKLESIGVTGKLLKLTESFLNERYQRVVLNGVTSEWSCIRAGVPQGSILGPLFFLVYINDLTTGLKCDVKLFADDTSLFSVVHDSNLSAIDLNHDLQIISDWTNQWKMFFNPDLLNKLKKSFFLVNCIK